jgi:ubiquinone/menaquinone biosynthesis C-methylase UbiE
MSGYYDTEAPVYDESRGGAERARAAAEAVADLVTGRGRAVDVAGGTGSVAAELAGLGWDPVVLDASAGMLSVAAGRLPGRVAVATAERLPVHDSSVDLVSTIWLLHLLPIALADRVIAEAARVLRAGGHFVTTVDKDLAHGRARRTNADHRDRVAATARRHGLAFLAATSFAGHSRWGSATEGDPVFPLAAFRKT